MGTGGGMDEEAARLAAVRRYDILDTPPDGAFDRITSLAARRCRTPIAIVSVVDTDRIWFKSHHGLEIDQIDREPGLCASAILHEGAWVIEDAAADPRTLANSLVAGDFGLRFYMGIPLRTADGYNLGTLCVLDFEPRETTAEEVADLTDLAAVVMDELELRRAARQQVAVEVELRKQAEELARSLQESLLPPALPRVDGLELAARYLPADRARVGGDFYDAFVDDHGVALVVGDVCGHGPRAAALTGIARHVVRALAKEAWSPSAVLSGINDAMLSSASVDDERFCTVAVLRLTHTRDPDAVPVTATVALGGHPHPRLVRSDSSVQRIGVAGSIVGSLGDASYPEIELTLSVGDVLVLFTDGLTDGSRESQPLEDVGLDQLLRSAAGQSAEFLADMLVAAATDGSPPRDDIAILIAKITG